MHDNIKEALRPMVEGTLWEISRINQITNVSGIELVLRVSETALAASATGGPTAVLDKLMIPAFKREARIADLERRIEVLNAKLEGVLLANGVRPEPVSVVRRG